MEGDECQKFKYRDRRRKRVDESTDPKGNMMQVKKLVAACLADRNAQHIFELGTTVEPQSEHLLHSAMSVVASRRSTHRASGLDEKIVPDVRLLPCKYQDVIQGGRYSSGISLDATDSLACFGRAKRIKNEREFLLLSNSFLGVESTIIKAPKA